MIGTVTFEMDRLMKTLKEIQPEMNKGMKTVVKDAAKVVVRKAIEMTPPGSDTVQGQAAKKRGEKKIGSDIRRVFATASYAYGTIKNKVKADAFWSLVKGRKKNLFDAQRIMEEESSNQRLRQAEVVENPDFTIHQRMRKRGTVPKSQRVLQVIGSDSKRGSLETYIKATQRKVGIWAAGWMPSVAKLKVSRIPAWVKRHAGKGRGRCIISENRDTFKIEMANSTGFGSLSKILPYALAGARGAMIKSAEVIKARSLAKAGLKK